MLSRRKLLTACAALAFPRIGNAQEKPRLIILGRGISSPILNINPSAPKREMSLEGWLVCNGAEISRTDYAELLSKMASAGNGDGANTFNLPNLPVEYKGKEAVRGVAICPSDSLGSFAATLMPFNVDSNI